MKIKPLIDFSEQEIILVSEAMTRYTCNAKLKDSDRKQFELDLEKVLMFGKEAELDGAGMKQVTRALKRRAALLYALKGAKRNDERKQLINLAFYIDCRFLEYNKLYGPELNKIFKNKIARQTAI